MRSAFRHLVYQLLVLTVFIHVANAQVTGTSTITAGSGTLTFNYRTSTYQCQDDNRRVGTQKTTSFNTFVYTEGGVSTSLSGSADDDWGATRVGGTCDPNSVDPVTLSGPTFQIVFTPQNQSGSATVSYSVTGYVNPKYLVVGVVYAPPGVSSTVAYSSSSTFSNTSNVSSMFGTATSVSVKISGSTGLPGVFHAVVTGTTTTAASQSSTSTSSTSVTFGQTVQTTFTGTPVFNVPVAHDYDTILIWLNPVVMLNLFPNQPGQVQFTGYGYDEADTNVQGLDILPVPVGCLNGDFPSANCQQFAAELSRSWATGQMFGPGQGSALTASDLLTIAAVDPFSNPAYVFSPTNTYPNTTTDGRFTLSGGQNGIFDYFSYVQANPGQQPGRTVFTNVYTDMNTLGQSETTTYSEAFGVDSNFSGGAFLSGISVDINTTQTLTWTNTSGSSVTNTNSQTDVATIVDPVCNGTVFCSPASTAPIQWNVYQDNIYGTFEFQP